MWTKRCMVTTKRGEQCKRRSITAWWTFLFQGEKFEHPTWVETCTHHDIEAMVSSVAGQDIRHFTR